MRLWDENPTEAPEHLVVAYRATASKRGVEKIVVGVPDSAETWQFGVCVYDRQAMLATDDVPKPMRPRYDAEDTQQPAPVILLRPQTNRDKQ
jgi:hypothetical protein